MRRLTGVIGIAAVLMFIVTFFVIGTLTPGFHFTDDYISKLGSRGQPYASAWNAIGFGIVGVAFALYGLLFGFCLNDRLLGVFLFVAGIGFAFAAIPTDFADEHSTLSKAHYASICFGLAGWYFGLARLFGTKLRNDFARSTAAYLIVLSALPMIAMKGGVSAEPVAHRVLITLIFMWVIANSLRLLRSHPTPPVAGHQSAAPEIQS